MLSDMVKSRNLEVENLSLNQNRVDAEKWINNGNIKNKNGFLIPQQTHLKNDVIELDIKEQPRQVQRGSVQKEQVQKHVTFNDTKVNALGLLNKLKTKPDETEPIKEILENQKEILKLLKEK